VNQAGVERALREVSGDLPVFDVTTLDAIGTMAVSSTSFQATLIGLFGAAAMLLAAIGVYGLLAHSVHQREYEMGVRLALGAEPAALRRVVVGEAAWLALIGAVIGVLLALGLTRALAGLLFGVTARDPVVFLTVPVVLALVAAVSAWLPARRAALLDPVDVLRRP
jgi:ABC-type antimicrobial peptide transport system permease subunit